MSAYLVWLILALVILGCEMMLGSIYLIACAAGAFCACIFALCDFSIAMQCSAAAVVTIAGVIAAIYFRRRLRTTLTPNKSADNLDKGQLVNVNEILKDGSARVSYRGALWTAYADNGSLHEGVYSVDRIDGTRLILSEKK